MCTSKITPPDRESQLESRVKAIRLELSQRDLDELKPATGSTCSVNESGYHAFTFQYWGQSVQVESPDFIATYSTTRKSLSTIHQALILYFFITADGAPIKNDWISFSALPDGKFYSQAFQGYTGKKIADYYGDNVLKIEQSALKLGGQKHNFSATAFKFQVLPRVPILLAYWPGDEDFHPSIQLLFDVSISHYLPTDACAIAGSMLTSRLMSQ